MNEEFGVLKDMIPACEGVEMHKLAILQAGIEYVRYLEGCVSTLKGQNQKKEKASARQHEEVVDEDTDASSHVPAKRHLSSRDSITSISRDSRLRRASLATTNTSAYPSPDILGSSYSITRASTNHSHTPSIASTPAQTPTPSLLSPAFTAFHFSPDLSRTGTNSTSATSMSISGPSPNILPLPLPQAALSMDSHPEATATAALMMLTNDRRGTISAGHDAMSKIKEREKGGMSVRDLLSS